MGRDFRLNYRLEQACIGDVNSICGDDVCDRQKESVCGGRVLRCLVEKKDQIKAESCKHEVQYFIKMEVCTQESAVCIRCCSQHAAVFVLGLSRCLSDREHTTEEFVTNC